MSGRRTIGSDPFDDYVPPTAPKEKAPEPPKPAKARPARTASNRKPFKVKREGSLPAPPTEERQRVTVYFDLEEYEALEKLWLKRRREAAPGGRRGFADFSSLVREAVRAAYL